MVIHDAEWVQRNYADAAGAIVLDVKSGSYAKGGRKERTIVYKCAKCGEIAEMGLNHLVYRHQNTEFHCKNCRKRKKSVSQRRFDFDLVFKFFKDHNVELLSGPDEIVNVMSNVRYSCISCGCENTTSLRNIFYRSEGQEFRFLCNNCKSNKSPTIEEIEDRFFKPVGVDLLTREYVNASAPLEFHCSCCGALAKTTYQRLNGGSNLELLCLNCNGHRMNEKLKNINGTSWEQIKLRRTKYDEVFLRYAYQIFNLEDKSLYSFHHIYPYHMHHELATSFSNIYPIKKEYHKYGSELYHDLHYPFAKPKLTIEDYPSDFKMPWYSEDFKFFDPTKIIVTEIVVPEYVTELAEHNKEFDGRVDATYSSALLNKKLEYAKNGILYLPFFYTEFLAKRQILLSMFIIRGESLYKGFSELYGFSIEHIFARKCRVEKISSNDALKFYDNAHIQGGVRANYNYGLFYKEELIGCMSFGKPRIKVDDSSLWELYRLAFKPFTIVPGGASKLFNAFIKDVNPKRIESFCDVRFVDSIESFYTDKKTGLGIKSVYDILGFKFDSITKPNYRYFDPLKKTFYSRMSYQKHLLKDKLEYFDSNLSEKENCKLNGLVPQYDCGNIKYIWENSNIENSNIEKDLQVNPGQVLDMFSY